MSAADTDAAELFRSVYGREAEGVWSAPGRVNLIGEHTDYNLGLVLPFAITDRARLAVRRTDQRHLRLTSARHPDDTVVVDLDTLTPREGQGSWADYLAGVWWVLAAEHGDVMVGGAEAALSSSVPVGAGLSSSAALECAMALALNELFGLGLDARSLAEMAQAAENDFVGVPCGLMDQLAATEGRDGHAMAIDFAAGTLEQVPFEPDSRGVALAVIDTQVHHDLAVGEYTKRRASCRQAADVLGVTHLSVPELAGLDPDALEGRLAPLDDVTRRRARHVITENDRVRAAVAHLREGRLAELGPLLDASHTSMALDFEITCPETDAAQRAALEAGALGARQTGGGFGGSVIALIDRDYIEPLTVAVTQALAAMGAETPVVRVMRPGPGARRDR